MRITPLLGLCSLLSVMPIQSAVLEEFPEYRFTGMCDASAGIFLSEDLLVVADDEQNLINTYSIEKKGSPISKLDLTSFLQVSRKNPEVDLEGAARVGDTIYWIASHGRNEKGEVRLSRQRFFATDVVNHALKTKGAPYVRLLEDLASAPGLAALNLRGAARSAPKDAGALNIEGLCARPDGSLLIAFRNPVPNEKALLVPLLNPAEICQGKPSIRARFGDPLFVDLGGKGIRDMVRIGATYYILAGEYDGGRKRELYQWTGGAIQEIKIKSEAKINLEALLPLPQGNEFLVLSDDGGRKTGGEKCKDLPPAQRSFRGFLLKLTSQ